MKNIPWAKMKKSENFLQLCSVAMVTPTHFDFIFTRKSYTLLGRGFYGCNGGKKFIYSSNLFCFFPFARSSRTNALAFQLNADSDSSGSIVPSSQWQTTRDIIARGYQIYWDFSICNLLKIWGISWGFESVKCDFEWFMFVYN